jgi:hypothetical protein
MAAILEPRADRFRYRLSQACFNQGAPQARVEYRRLGNKSGTTLSPLFAVRTPETGDLIAKVGRKGGIMRATVITLSLVGLLFTGVSLSLAQPAQTPAVQVPWHPCAQIRAACTQAGFVPNGEKVGAGMTVDCIKPIMVGTPQRQQATKPLPPLDPQVVVACKERNPNFGMEGGQPLFAFKMPR